MTDAGRQPVLVALSGLPGTGKSTLARRVSRELTGLWLRIDSLEQAIREAGIPPDSIGDAGYRAAHAVATDNLGSGVSVVADCVNPWMLTRDAWRDIAHAAGADLIEVEIVCSDAAEHKARIDKRSSETSGVRPVTWAAVLARDYRAWTRPCARIDTAHRSIDAALVDLRAAILNRPA